VACGATWGTCTALPLATGGAPSAWACHGRSARCAQPFLEASLFSVTEQAESLARGFCTRTWDHFLTERGGLALQRMMVVYNTRRASPPPVATKFLAAARS